MRCHEFGGETAKGAPCERRAGWGRDASSGRCKFHHVGRPEVEVTDGGTYVPPDAPATLSEEAASVWDEVVHRLEFVPEELLVLQGGLEAWDAYRTARARLEREGPVKELEGGSVKRNPAALVARDSFRDFRDMLGHLELGMPDEAGG